MKVKTTQRFLPVHDSFLAPSTWKSGQKSICASHLDEIFNIPREAKRLWFTFHTRPHEDRVKLKIDIDDDTYPSILVDGEQLGWYYRAYEYVKRLVDKHGTLYVECHYED